MIYLATLRKEIQLMMADGGAMFSAFGLPVIFIVIFGLMFGTDASEKKLTLAVSSEIDASALKRVEALDLFDVSVVDESGQVLEALSRGSAAVGLMVASPEPTSPQRELQIVFEDAFPATFKPLVTWALGHSRTGAPARTSKISVRPKRPESIGRRLSGYELSVAGNVVLFGFFLALSVAMSFVEERRTCALDRVRCSSNSLATILVAKMIPFIIIGMVQLAVVFLVGYFLFDVRISGSYFGLVALSLAFTVCAAVFGLVLSMLGKDEKQVAGVASMLILSLGALGGAMVPRFMMPDVLKGLALATPHAWALDGYYRIIGDPSSTLGSVSMEISIVLLFAAVFLAVGLFAFRRSVLR